MLQKPAWNTFTKDVDSLAMVLEKYSVHLNQQAAGVRAWQRLDHVVWPLSQFSDFELRSVMSHMC